MYQYGSVPLLGFVSSLPANLRRQTYGQSDRRMDADGRTGRTTDGRSDGRTDGRSDGRTDQRTV